MYKLLITQKKNGKSISVRGSLEQIKEIIPLCCIPNFNVNSIDSMEKPIEVNMRSATISIKKIEKDAGRLKLDLDLIVKALVSIVKPEDGSDKISMDKAFVDKIKSELEKILASV